MMCCNPYKKWLTLILKGEYYNHRSESFYGAFVSCARHKKAEEIVRGSSDVPVIKS